MSKPTKVDHAKELVKQGVLDPKSVFSAIRRLAQDEDWRVREVAATALVGISRKQSDKILGEMKKWASSKNENVRRTAIESLRGIARVDPSAVVPVLEMLRSDASAYVKKSVANIMRDASKGNPELIFKLALKWSTSKDKNTQWIVKNGIKKLPGHQQKTVLVRVSE